MFDGFTHADRRLLWAIARKLELVEESGSAALELEKLMSKEIDDLNAAVSGLSTAVTSAVQDIQAQAQAILNASNNDDSAGVEAAVAQINQLTSTLTSAVTPVQQAAQAAATASS